MGGRDHRLAFHRRPLRASHGAVERRMTRSGPSNHDAQVALTSLQQVLRSEKRNVIDDDWCHTRASLMCRRDQTDDAVRPLHVRWMLHTLDPGCACYSSTLARAYLR